MNLIKQLFCKHNFKFIRNIYGDEINLHNGNRSEWKCKKCGKTKYQQQYVELENREQLEVTILYIKSKIRDLNYWKEQEIDRLAKFGETIKAVVFLKEKEFITDYNGKKRHLYWQEIADKVYCSEKSARNWYKLATEERKKSI